MRAPNQKPRKSLNLVRSLLAWFGQNARDLPWRRTTDPYAIWISEVMLQQTQVKTVIDYWTRWMKRFPDARALARARPQEVLKSWEGLGYYARARNAHAAARVIVQKFGGQFPAAFDDVLALPGVGRYTAGAVCSIALNQPRPIVDANAARVLCRIFGIRRHPHQKTANSQLWSLAQELVEVADSQADPTPPAETPAAATRTCSAFNQSLMELGALVCTPLQPQCAVCPVRHWCFAYDAGRVGQIPAPRPPARLTRRRFIAFIVQKKNRFLTRQRPAGAVNAHFWEFPNIEIGPAGKDLGALAHPFVLTEAAPCCRLFHSITRYRIELAAYRAELTEEAVKNRDMGVWRTAAQLRRIPLASSHRRILEHLADKSSTSRNDERSRCEGSQGKA
jgi:A/G-specific adenine glycosylase